MPCAFHRHVHSLSAESELLCGLGEDQSGSVQCDYNIIYFLDFSIDSTLKKYFNQHHDLNTEIKSQK